MQQAIVTHYTVTNRKTGTVKTYKTRNAATKAADKQDNAYGSYISTVKAHWSDGAA